MKEDFIERGLSAQFAVRYLLADCTQSVHTARERHSLNPHAAYVCAQLMLTTCLLSAYIKDQEHLTIQLQNNTPKSSFTADINAQGHIRAKLSPNEFMQAQSTVDGVLLVVKHNQKRELYRGMTDIDHKTIVDALQHHLVQSTQILSQVQFFIAHDLSHVQAILFEKLPSSEDLPSLSNEEFHERYTQLRQEDIRTAITSRSLRGSAMHSLETRALKWVCKCSRARVIKMLCGLGKTEIQAIIDEVGYAEVTCHFCNKRVQLDKEELYTLLNTL